METERLFSNILTLVRTDCGFMAGSSSGFSSLTGADLGASRSEGEEFSALGGGVALVSEFTGIGSYC